MAPDSRESDRHAAQDVSTLAHNKSPFAQTMRFHNAGFRRTLEPAPRHMPMAAMPRRPPLGNVNGRTAPRLSSYSRHQISTGLLASEALGSRSNSSPLDRIYALPLPRFSSGHRHMAHSDLLVTDAIQHIQ